MEQGFIVVQLIGSKEPISRVPQAWEYEALLELFVNRPNRHIDIWIRLYNLGQTLAGCKDAHQMDLGDSPLTVVEWDE